MKHKKYVALLLACVLALGCLAGCGSTTQKTTTSKDANLPLDEDGNPSHLGKYAEPVTLNIVSGYSPTDSFPEGDSTTDNYYTRWLKENVNVEVKYMWQASSSDYEQKFSLMLASGELPDIMMLSRSEMDMLIEADMLEDLSPYMDIYLCDNLKEKDEAGKERFVDVTRGDKILAYPNSAIVQYDMMWIRKDWLDKLGLEMPSTMEDVEAVAKAFVDNNMGGENTIGILTPTAGSNLYATYTSGRPMYNLDFAFQNYESYPGYWVEGDDGKVVYGSTTEETKKALGKLQQLYADGILDQELGIRADADAAWKSGKAGILSMQWWFGFPGFKEALAIDPTADWKAFVIEGENGKWNVKDTAITNTYIAVRKGYEHPELALMLPSIWEEYKAQFETESNIPAGYWPMFTNFGYLDNMDYVAGKVFEYIENGIDEGVLPEFNPKYTANLEPDMLSVPEMLEAPYDDFSIEKFDTSHDRFERTYTLLVGQGTILKAQEAGLKNNKGSLIWYKTETAKQKWDNLWKKEQEAFTKIILGEESLDYFDTFVEEWKAEGGEEITAEVQEYVNSISE